MSEDPEKEDQPEVLIPERSTEDQIKDLVPESLREDRPKVAVVGGHVGWGGLRTSTTRHLPLGLMLALHDDGVDMERETNRFLEAVSRGPAAYGPGPRRKADKPMRKCRLPGCNVQTAHNGGYCCPEHCKEDRAR